MSVTDVFQLIFEVYIFALILRLLLQYFGANYYNQICQFVVKITNPVVTPLRKVLPRSQHIDFATLSVILILQVIKFALLVLIDTGIMPNFAGLLVVSIADSIKTLLNVFVFAILGIVLISWLNPQLRSPVTEILNTITEPLLGRARRLIPHVGGLDLSPLPVMILLKLSAYYLVTPIMAAGISMSIRGFGV